MPDTDPRHQDDIESQGWPQDGFSQDLGRGGEASDTGAPGEATRQLANGELPALDRILDPGELDRVYVLATGTALEQGSTYIDLARLDEGPFVAIGGRTANEEERLLSKRAVDYELWNKLAGDRERRVERPQD